MTLSDDLWASLSDEDIAASAVNGVRGETFVKQVTWVKDFSGQVTDGRIGRPAIKLCPISWLPQARRLRVEKLIRKHREGALK